MFTVATGFRIVLSGSSVKPGLRGILDAYKSWTCPFAPTSDGLQPGRDGLQPGISGGFLRLRRALSLYSGILACLVRGLCQTGCAQTVLPHCPLVHSCHACASRCIQLVLICSARPPFWHCVVGARATDGRGVFVRF